MNLAERLKIARESIGNSQKEIAEAAHVSYRAWQGYETGESVPGGKVFEALVKLGFDGTWLLTGEGEMKRGEVAARPAVDAGPALDLALMEEVIIELIKAQKGPGDEVHDLVTEVQARQTSSTILNIYKTRIAMPSMPLDTIISNFNNRIANLTDNDTLNKIADKRACDEQAGDSPVKQTTASYDDDFAELVKNMSNEEKEELRAILKERIDQALENESLNDLTELRPTGT